MGSRALKLGQDVALPQVLHQHQQELSNGAVHPCFICVLNLRVFCTAAKVFQPF